MKLYEISADIERLLSQDEDGELPPDVAKQLDLLQVQLDEKADAICRFRAGLVAEAAAYKAEAERLEARAKSFERHADWLKAYLMNTMERLGLDKIKTELFSLRIQKNSRPSISLA